MHSTVLSRARCCAPATLRAPRNCGCRAARQGVTLVELLVVIGLMAALVALLSPALQQSREAARRTRCASQLRQLGVGLHAYHAAYRTFPPGCVDPKGKRLAWSVFVLPFVEQHAVWRSFDVSRPYSGPENRAAGGVVLPMYLCPSTARFTSDRTGSTSGDRNGNARYDPGDDLAWTDYGGIFGAAFPGETDFMNGVMIWDRAIRLGQIRDGASHTLMLGEDTGRGWKLDSEWANGENVFDVAERVNITQHNELWSDHPRGVLVLYCDGGARWLDEGTSSTLLQSIATRNGGETVEP